MVLIKEHQRIILGFDKNSKIQSKLAEKPSNILISGFNVVQAWKVSDYVYHVLIKIILQLHHTIIQMKFIIIIHNL